VGKEGGGRWKSSQDSDRGGNSERWHIKGITIRVDNRGERKLQNGREEKKGRSRDQGDMSPGKFVRGGSGSPCTLWVK